MMRFYQQQHRFYCGIDLHTRTLSLCVLDSAGVIVCEATLPPEPDQLRATLALYRDGLVIGCECPRTKGICSAAHQSASQYQANRENGRSRSLRKE